MAQSGHIPQKIQQSLEELLIELKLKEYELEFSEGSSKGDNYLGIITKVTVTEKENKNDTKIVRLVVKSAPQALEFRNYIKIEILNEREVFMYENVFPELLRFQARIGLKEIFNPVPKCYKTSTTIPYEHLIFDDMIYQGYRMKDRKTILDLDQCTTVLETYGKFHALALALKAREPETYEKLSEGTRESFYSKVNLERLCQTIKGVTDKVVNSLDRNDDKEIIAKINDFARYPVNELLENLSAEVADGKAVFCHGDCWINNILFKCKDNSSAPAEVCLLDWQLSISASPAVDVAYFIFASTDKQLRDSHYDEMLDIYYSSLSSFLEKLDCSAAIFTKECLLSHMERFSKYGLMMCFIVVPLCTAEMDEIPDWTSNMQEGERAYMFAKERKNEKYIVTTLTDIVKDFIRLGYL